MLTESIQVVAITVICYLIAAGVKATPVDNKWLPVIVGVGGGILGIVGFYTMTNFPASDPLSAVAVGIVSGLAATGSNQILKQLSTKSTTGADTGKDTDSAKTE